MSLAPILFISFIAYLRIREDRKKRTADFESGWRYHKRSKKQITEGSTIPDKGSWAVLGIEPTNDVQAIKKAYRKRIKEHHPDVSRDKIEAHRKMIQLNEAYNDAIHGL